MDDAPLEGAPLLGQHPLEASALGARLPRPALRRRRLRSTYARMTGFRFYWWLRRGCVQLQAYVQSGTASIQ